MARNNPMFKTMKKVRSNEDSTSITGVIVKTFIVLAMLFATSAFAFMKTTAGEFTSGSFMGMFIGSLLVGLVLAIATAFKPKIAPVTAPIYGAVEGIVLGFLTALLESKYPGIAFQAILATVGVLFAMLFLYGTRIIKPTPTLLRGITIATFGVLIMYLLTMILGLFGVNVAFMHDSGPLSIIISLVVVGIAAFNLIQDFYYIEEYTKQGAPKYMEWFSAMTLTITLVWLYVEILDLVRKFRD